MRRRDPSTARVRESGSVAGWLLVLTATVAIAGSGTRGGAVPPVHAGVGTASIAGDEVYSYPHRLCPLPAASAAPAATAVPAPGANSTVAQAPARAVALARPPAPPRHSAPPPPPPPGSSSAAANAVFAAINASRAAAGLPALAWNAGLSRSAHLHNLAMAAADQLSHQLPGEASLGTRISAQGVHWTWAGENVGSSSNLSTAGALGLEQAMVNETPPNDPHRLDILTTSGNSVGVDVVLDTAHNVLWLTEDFAN